MREERQNAELIAAVEKGKNEPATTRAPSIGTFPYRYSSHLSTHYLKQLSTT
jgi:hypothetical protein